MNSTTRGRLIVGLDVPTVRDAEKLVMKLSDDVSFYKVGYQLAFSGGLSLAADLIAAGKKVFLDLKLLDIDNTIANAVENIAKMGVSMLTVHAHPQTMRAAVAAAKGSDLCLLGVTVLTSMDDHDLADAGYAMSTKQLVATRAQQARDCGMGGIVAGATEAAMVRPIIGEDLALVTPGIRPTNAASYDQKRISTPEDALRAGASHLVVARPIIKAPSPQTAARSILMEMQNALNEIG